jgi:hypothetical protein
MPVGDALHYALKVCCLAFGRLFSFGRHPLRIAGAEPDFQIKLVSLALMTILAAHFSELSTH